MLEITLIFNKSNASDDATLLQRSLAGLAKVRFADPLEPPVACDVNIHLEIPIYAYVPWSNYNVFMKNPEQYIKESYDPYMKHFDLVVTKEELQTNSKQILDSLVKKDLAKPKLPPILTPDKSPPISIVTLMYNRRRFFDLACHNIMISDYPKDKIEWIIVEDSDDISEDSSDKIISTAQQSKPLEIVYIPLKKKTSISEKRNLGVLRAKNDIVLFMDDDDHYPITSFRRRVAWLTLHPSKPKATVCTTIACYDLKKGISAVNSPPLDLPLGQRISEATLTFYKSWFLERMFDKTVQIGEGDYLIKGRESDVMELPPQQILVAFSHGNNASSRRIPSNDSVEPSCFWGFPQEYLQFIHSLANISLILN